MPNTKKVYGKFGEAYAVKYLKQKGYRIIKRNWTCRWGEIDAIGEKDKTLVFFEVKIRSSNFFGHSSESISYFKKKHLKRSIDFYLAQCDKEYKGFRFDVVCLDEVSGKISINHYENVSIE